MALTLITPTGAVTTFSSGIIAVRCQDYIGASAGASVVTDALSVGGDVIKEEQEIAVQTTNQTQSDLWDLADNSVTIPIGDVPVDPDINNGYEILVGIRTEGDPPLTATYKATDLLYGEGGSTVGVGFGDDLFGYYDGPGSLARKHVPHYVIYDLGSWYYDASVTELILRGWGVTGGDIAIYFDMMYMLPITADAGTDNPQIPLTFDTNGTLVHDDDNDTSSAPWLGKFSVVNWRAPWVAPFSPPGGLIEMQEADDESTSFETDQGYNDPRQSYLAYVVGTTQVDAHTVFSEDFEGTAPLHGIEQYQWQLAEGYIGDMESEPAGALPRGFRMEDGFARCYLPANQVENLYDEGGYGRVRIGLVENFADAVPAITPDERVPTLNIQNGVFLAKVRFDTVQESWAMAGVVITPITDAVDWSRAGGRLDLDGGGNLTLSVVFTTDTVSNTSAADDYIIDGPVTINAGYSANEWVWIKAERRGYTWRARAWMDGDTEPSTWDVEGPEPMVSRNSVNSLRTLIDYPWDDNWNGDTDSDVMIYDPRGNNGERLVGYPSFPTIFGGVGPSLAAMLIEYESFELTYDPGAGTPGDVNTKTLKYDDSVVIDSTVTVPYGSHRIVQGPLATRHFNISTTKDGFNIRVWKDSGFPDLTPAIVGEVWEKFVDVLWGDIKHP